MNATAYPGRPRSRRGANAIEFALLAPVLVLLLTGIMDAGWMLMLREACDSAARDGARAAAFADDNSVAAPAVQQRWRRFGLPGTITTTVARTGSPEMVVVDVRLSAKTLVGLAIGDHLIRVTTVKRVRAKP